MTAIKKNIYLITCLLTLCISSLPSQEGEDLKKSEKYDEVERLIENYDYNSAINILVEIVKEEPEEMDRAQKMIQDIRKKKEEFNKKYEELIRVLFEENDYQKGLEIISELEELDQNPNTSTSESLTDARISAELIYFKLLFQEIMDRALVEINAQRYNQALNIYRTGFELHRRTYEEREYGDIVKGPVNSNLALLLESMDTFVKDYEILANHSRINSTTSIEANQQLQPDFMEDFFEFSELRNAVWKAGFVFEEQNKLIGEMDNDIREDFFLSFSNRIVFGRLDRLYEEGIIHAMDEYWENHLRTIQQKLNQKLTQTMDTAERAYRSGNWEQAITLFDEAVYWSETGMDLASLWNDRINLDPNYVIYPGAEEIIATEYVNQENMRIQKNKAEYHRDLCLFKQKYNEYQIYDDQDLPLMSERRKELEEDLLTLLPMKERWMDYTDSYDRDILYTDIFAAQEQVVYRDRIDQGILEYQTLNGQIALDSADFEILPLEKRYEDMKNAMARSLNLLDGIQPDGAEEGDLSILYVYPEDSFSILERLKEENVSLSRDANNYKGEYQTVRNEIPQKEPMAVYISRAEAIILNLQNDIREYTRLQRRADQNIASAERYLGEGEFRFREAESALNRKDFNQAVQQLSTAQELFVEALSFNENIINRADLDKRVSDLQAKIIFEENKEVIRYVRESVNKGKSLYLQGLYGQSEVILLKAESRWFSTNAEPNSEITYWMNLVRAALSVESGRTIEETEPLYKEMTQFLNLAFANFEAGKSKIESGDRDGGFFLLDKADQNLNEILIPMPLNQQASVLKLKIQQLRDPELFKITFEEKFKSAVSKLRTETDTSYIDLKDLSAIQSNYPGMSKAIYDAEILLGIRRPPPNLKALAESKDLYEKAFQIVEGNVRSQFPVALKQLDRSIELNPENQAAIELKDRIQLDAGGQTTVVLSSAANAKFKSAEEKYINGEYFEAYAIVQQLLNDKATASYPPLQELKRRLESKF